MTGNHGRILIAAVTAVLLMAPAVCATPPPPPSTPCSAPEFRKVGELVVPPCGTTTDTVTVSGRVIVSNRKPAEIAHALLLRKGKIIAHGAVAAAADDPNASDLSFEYTEPTASYLTPIDFVIAPQCGPALSISVDRPGRCP